MKIIKNTTRYTNKSWSRIISIIKREEKRQNGKVDWKIGDIWYLRNGKYLDSTGGRAFMRSGKVTLTVGKHPDKEDLIFTILHELQHNRGYGHKKINDPLLKEWAKKIFPKVPELELK